MLHGNNSDGIRRGFLKLGFYDPKGISEAGCAVREVGLEKVTG